MIHNDTEFIALNSNDDDVFYLISLRRNHKDHLSHTKILGRGYSPRVIPRYTDLQLDLQFRHHFRMSRPTVAQICYCWVIALRSRVNSTTPRLLDKFEFPARISNKTCLNLQVLWKVVHQIQCQLKGLHFKTIISII